MHELALAESMLQIVEDAARRSAAGKVAAVNLEIGALSAVEPDALAFCFHAVARGTIAEGARLEIAATPGAAWCTPCGGRVPLGALGDACPQCGGYQLKVIEGNGMRVRDIAVAD